MIRTSSMNASNKVIYTPEEYLSLGADFDLNQERYYSDWLAYPDATQSHQVLSGNLLTLFREHLQNQETSSTDNVNSSEQYHVYSRTIRFEVVRDQFYSNPDLFVGKHPEDSASPLFKKYPTLIGEVVTKVTDEFDRQYKFKKYFTCNTLCSYLLVSQYTLRVELYTRNNSDEQWGYSTFESLDDMVTIPSLGIELSVREIYKGTKLDKQKLPPLNQ